MKNSIFYIKNGKETDVVKPKYGHYLDCLRKNINENSKLIAFYDLKSWERNKGFWNLRLVKYNNLVDILNYYKIPFEELNKTNDKSKIYIEVKIDKRRKCFRDILELKKML